MENSFKQTLKEIFSVSALPEEAVAVAGAGAGRQTERTAAAAVRMSAAMSAPHGEERHASPAASAGRARAAASYLAAGTAFEGTLRSAGDVEIAGSFKGDVVSNGKVLLRTDIESNITAGSLVLAGCSLVGSVVVNGTVTISEGAKVVGNITARELMCAGEVTGDLRITGNTMLEEKAKINGHIVTGTISVVKGAVIKGGVEMKLPTVPAGQEAETEAEASGEAQA